MAASKLALTCRGGENKLRIFGSDNKHVKTKAHKKKAHADDAFKVVKKQEFAFALPQHGLR